MALFGGPFVILRVIGYNLGMYRYYAKTRSPLSLWILDGVSPHFDATGMDVSATASGSPTYSVPLVPGAARSTVVKNSATLSFPCNVFRSGQEDKPFILEAWILPIPKTTTADQQILSHSGLMDGLTINGKVISFSTRYATAGSAICSYDLEQYKLAHIVGVHTSDKNELWVNGNMVSSVDITDEQKADTYATTTDLLHSGVTSSDQEIALNAVAIYTSLSGEQILQNYLAGTDFLSRERVAPQNGGISIPTSGDSSAVFIKESWVSISDFYRGLNNNVVYSQDKIVPRELTTVSEAGSWTASVPLDVRGDTNIYGVGVEWSALGVTVETSLDGSVWSPVVNGGLVAGISPGYDPTGEDLQIRVSFLGGVAQDPSYLESLSVIGLANSLIDNSLSRTVSVSQPALPRSDREPMTFRDDSGVSLSGGTLTIGTDSSEEPTPARTLEMWVKVKSGNITTNFTGTSYRNGAANTTSPVGEWSLIHVSSGSDFNSSITISGDIVISHIALYPTTLSSDQVSQIYSSYTGNNVTRLVDNNTVGVAENAVPAAIYSHDWAINSAG